MNKILKIVFTTALLLSLILTTQSAQQEKGETRLRRLRELTAASSNNVIQFSHDDFKQYALSYPRPYDLVLYFVAPACKLCEELLPQYNYMAELYYQQGAITAEKNPTFFVKVSYSRATTQLYKTFGFITAPNLVVSKPFMAMVSDIQKKDYVQKMKWAISYSDGHVTCHKLLQFVNKRTDRNIIYKPTLTTMLQTFFGFVIIAAIGVYIYLNMKAIWTNWIIWFAGSMFVYVVCVSGVIYDIIHDVPFVGRDPKTGQAVVFAGGNREQYGAQGLIISVLLSGIGLLFISIFTIGPKLPTGINRIFCFVSLLLIVILVFSLEDGYKSKSWYGPSFRPPADYRTGPISSDQGNNI